MSLISRKDFLRLSGLGLGAAACGPLGRGASGVEVWPEPELDGARTRWTSPENPRGEKGAGATENRGAKGHAFDQIPAGESLDLLNVRGPGIVNRIKMTTDDRSPEMLRALRIDMYWDGASKPAVSSPLGDFFGVGLGRTAVFESDFFSNPEGRSFNCFIQMPFRSGGRITITNESDSDLHHIFYNVNYLLLRSPPESRAYFHAYWHRDPATTLGEDFEILPRVRGSGRFLGASLGVIANPAYGTFWWGEGEVKMYLDGDRQWPTLVGTGTEDYIGTAWGQGVFANRYQGSTIADAEHGRWAFYRYHIPDPVLFDEDLLVTVQQIGGGPKQDVVALAARGVPLEPISVDSNGTFLKLLEMDQVPALPDLPEGWINFYRRDDWSATAYFYLTEPTSNLPALGGVAGRTSGLGDGGAEIERADQPEGG